MLNGKYIDEESDENWYKSGQPYRDDGPAMITTDGEERWYQNGKWFDQSEILILRDKISFNKMMKGMFTD